MDNRQIISYAQNMLRDPKVRQSLPNAPWVEPAVNALLNNDSAQGQMIAKNLLQSSGITPEQLNNVIQNGMQNLRFPF